MGNKLEQEEVKIEQIGLIPVILEMLNRIHLIEMIDTHYNHHGNWVGASKGTITAVWISYIISNCDHRLCCLEDWVRQNEISLNSYLSEFGYIISPKDCTDAKLELLLEDFSKEEKWWLFEQQINRSFISVYKFKTKVIQLDPTIGKSFKKGIEDGLFQYGNSKHFRSDLPQFKTIIANLVGGNMPLAAITVSGEQADDVLYVPMIKEAKKSLDENGLLWVGDAKLPSMGNRHYIQSIGDYYMGPLSKVQLPEKVLYKKYVSAVLEGTIKLEEIERDGEVIASGYEVTESRSHEGSEWKERQLIVRSESYQSSQTKALDARLKKCGDALVNLNNSNTQGKKVFKDEKSLREACEKIIHTHKVENLLEVTYRITYQEKEIRAYKDNPARIEKQMTYHILVSKKKEAIERQKAMMGWRVYVTNHPSETLSLSDAVNLYREEYGIERRIRNLKEEVTALLPIFLKKDNRISALINMLILVLKLVAGIEHEVATTLKEKGKELAGLYPGNPKITTPTPTIRKIIEVFKTISIAYIKQGQKITRVLIPELSIVQKEILDLLGLPADLYKKLEQIAPILNSR